MEATQNHFSKLPEEVLEHIFQYFDFQDLLLCKSCMPELEDACHRYIVRNCYSILNDIVQCLEKLDGRINGSNHLKLIDKRRLFATTTLLENLKQCSELILIMCRPDLGFQNINKSFASIFDNTSVVISLVKDDPFALTDFCSGSRSDFADFFENSELLEYDYMGVRIVDYLDAILQVQYNISVTYFLKRNFCTISGYYYLKHSKLLFYLPNIPFIKSCTDRQLSETEKTMLLKYLGLLIGVHNRLIIKSEHKVQLSLTSFCRHCSTRNVIDYDNGIVNETYTNCNDDFLQFQGIKCVINLNCGIDAAPLLITKSCHKMVSELFGIDAETKSDFNGDLEDVYAFDIRLEINLSQKKPHKDDLLEFHLHDGGK